MFLIKYRCSATKLNIHQLPNAEAFGYKDFVSPKLKLNKPQSGKIFVTTSFNLWKKKSKIKLAPAERHKIRK